MLWQGRNRCSIYVAYYIAIYCTMAMMSSMRRLEASPHCAITMRYALEMSWHMVCCVAWLLHARWSSVHTMFRLLIGLAHPVCPMLAQAFCYERVYTKTKQLSCAIAVLCTDCHTQTSVAEHDSVKVACLTGQASALALQMCATMLSCVLQSCCILACTHQKSAVLPAGAVPEGSFAQAAGRCTIGNFFACADGHMATQQNLITRGVNNVVGSRLCEHDRTARLSSGLCLLLCGQKAGL